MRNELRPVSERLESIERDNATQAEQLRKVEQQLATLITLVEKLGSANDNVVAAVPMPRNACIPHSRSRDRSRPAKTICGYACAVRSLY